MVVPGDVGFQSFLENEHHSTEKVTRTGIRVWLNGRRHEGVGRTRTRFSSIKNVS